MATNPNVIEQRLNGIKHSVENAARRGERFVYDYFSELPKDWQEVIKKRLELDDYEVQRCWFSGGYKIKW